jgi:hypothetical protein
LVQWLFATTIRRLHPIGSRFSLGSHKTCTQVRLHLLQATSSRRQLCRAPQLLVSGCTRSTSTSPCAATTRLRLHVLYLNLAVRCDYSSLAARALRQPCRTPRLLVTRPHMLYVNLVSGCLGTSRGSSRGSSHRSSSTTPPRRLVVDYFTYAARPGASARRTARHAARCAARRRLLRPRRASGCLGMSRSPSRGSSSTTPCAATSSCGHAGSTLATPCVVTTCLTATLALLRVRHAPPRRHLPVASRRPFISTSFPN